jgi:hypothetical protein
VPGLCDTEVPELRLVTGDAHRAACHYAETLEGVTVESLRSRAEEHELVAAEVGADIGPDTTADVPPETDTGESPS